jgi:phospho-N-acetylmuramoyl-pentapeptide-transferase
MFYYLHYLSDWFGPLNVFRYITFRAVMAAVTAMVLSLVFGPRVIRWLTSLKYGQPIRGEDDLRELAARHGEKRGTPTMGGLLIILALEISCLLWAIWTNVYIQMTLLCVVYLGALGFLDDYQKVTKKDTKGLSARTKLLAQAALAVIIGLFLVQDPLFREFRVPFVKTPIIADMGMVAAVLFMIAVIAGSSNAVNLTDGLDGLAIGCTICVALALAVMTYAAGNINIAGYLQIPYVPGAGELTVFCAALVGAGLGFLWYNAHPADVFMGDTGSLALGGAIGIVAILARQELALILIGGVFVMEAGSVLLQVGSFKLRGKRIFLMSPIHHHFERKGWSETKVVVRFWILSIIFALIGLSTLKVR